MYDYAQDNADSRALKQDESSRSEILTINVDALPDTGRYTPLTLGRLRIFLNA